MALFFEERDELVQKLLRFSLNDDFALIVSSANKSGRGNCYQLSDIPEDIQRGVDLVIYENKSCKYHAIARNEDRNFGSTIVDLKTRRILRSGVLVREIQRQMGG